MCPRAHTTTRPLSHLLPVRSVSSHTLWHSSSQLCSLVVNQSTRVNFPSSLSQLKPRPLSHSRLKPRPLSCGSHSSSHAPSLTHGSNPAPSLVPLILKPRPFLNHGCPHWFNTYSGRLSGDVRGNADESAVACEVGGMQCFYSINTVSAPY